MDKFDKLIQEKVKSFENSEDSNLQPPDYNFNRLPKSRKRFNLLALAAVSISSVLLTSLFWYFYLANNKSNMNVEISKTAAVAHINKKAHSQLIQNVDHNSFELNQQIDDQSNTFQSLDKTNKRNVGEGATSKNFNTKAQLNSIEAFVSNNSYTLSQSMKLGDDIIIPLQDNMKFEVTKNSLGASDFIAEQTTSLTNQLVNSKIAKITSKFEFVPLKSKRTKLSIGLNIIDLYLPEVNRSLSKPYYVKANIGVTAYKLKVNSRLRMGHEERKSVTLKGNAPAYSLLAGYPLGKRWSIESGFSHASFKQELTHHSKIAILKKNIQSQGNREELTEDIEIPTALGYRSVTTTLVANTPGSFNDKDSLNFDINFKTKMSVNNLPLRMAYSYPIGKKFAIQLYGGITLSFVKEQSEVSFDARNFMDGQMNNRPDIKHFKSRQRHDPKNLEKPKTTNINVGTGFNLIYAINENINLLCSFDTEKSIKNYTAGNFSSQFRNNTINMGSLVNF